MHVAGYLTFLFVFLSGMAVEDVVSAKLVLSKLKEGGAPLSTLEPVIIFFF